MDPIEIKYKYSEADIKTACKEVLQHQKLALLIMFLRNLLLCCILYCASIIGFLSSLMNHISVQAFWGVLSDWRTALTGIFYSLVWATIITIKSYRVALQTAVKNFNQYWELHLAKTARFGDDKVEYEADQMYVTSAWARYNKALETKTNFLLYLTDLQFVIIPKRSFVDINQESQFRSLVKEKISVFRSTA